MSIFKRKKVQPDTLDSSTSDDEPIFEDLSAKNGSFMPARKTPAVSKPTAPSSPKVSAAPQAQKPHPSVTAPTPSVPTTPVLAASPAKVATQKPSVDSGDFSPKAKDEPHQPSQGSEQKKKFAKSTLQVIISNGLLLLAGLLSGFFVPKLLGVDDYGYFKTFTLYASYVTVLHFGLINGVFLKYGDKDLNELSPSRFRLYSRILFTLELAVAAIFIAVGLVAFNDENRIICLLLAAYTLVVNGSTYFQQLSQITQRFKEYSLTLLLQSVLKIVAVAALWVVSAAQISSLISFEFYGICYTGIFAVILIWYLVIYRKLVFGKADHLREAKADVLGLFKLGLPLLIADFVVTLIYSCGSQVVNLYFSTDQFAYFSFAYTVTNLITVVMSAVSTVLYPAMKRMDEEHLKEVFQRNISLLLLAGFALVIAYFPISFIIKKGLPEYVGSLDVLKVAFPGIVVTSAINIIIQNYYKTTNKNFLYFLICLGILGLSIGLNVGACYLFNNITAVAASSVIAFFVWYVVAQVYFVKKWQIRIGKNLIYALLLTGSFYASVFISDSLIVSLFIYLILFLVISVWFFFENIRDFVICLFENAKNKAQTPEAKNSISSKEDNFVYDIEIVRKRKKDVLSFFIIVALLFSSGMVSGALAANSLPDALASEVVRERDNGGYSFAYGEVTAEAYPDDSFTQYKNSVKNAFGLDMKKTSRVFFHSGIQEDFCPMQFEIPGKDNLKSQVIASYSADITNNNYGFEVLSGTSFDDFPEDSAKFYITQGLADDLISQDPSLGGEDYSHFSNYSFKGRVSHVKGIEVEYPFTVVGVISDASLGDFKTAFGSEFVFCQYNSILYYFGGSTISFFMYGQFVATSSLLSIFEGQCRAYGNNYSTVYYNHAADGSLVTGSLQANKEASRIFYTNGSPRYLLVGCFAFVCIICIFYLIVKIKAIDAEKDQKKRLFISQTYPFITIFSFSLIYAILYILNGFVIGHTIYVTLGYQAVSVAFVLLVLLVIGLASVYSLSPNDSDLPQKGGDK
jgi:O-antigen/teichoic acid export membrane protein